MIHWGQSEFYDDVFILCQTLVFEHRSLGIGWQDFLTIGIIPRDFFETNIEI